MKRDVVLLEVMLLGSSLSNLNTIGSGAREVEYYERLGEHFEVQLFGYTGALHHSKFIDVEPTIHNKWIYSLIGPLLQRGKFTKAKVVRSKQLWGCWAGWIFSKLFGCPFIIRCGYVWSDCFLKERPRMGKIGATLIRKIESILISLGDAYIFTVDHVYQKYSNQIVGKKYAIIPNGYNTECFAVKSITKKYDYVYVGRLIELKGIDLILDAAKSFPEAKFLVIGDGPYREKISECKNVELISHVQNHDLPKYFNESTAVISLSRTEGNPKATIEGILCGLYPVLSNIPAHQEIVEQLGYGMIVEDIAEVPNKDDELKIDSELLEKFRIPNDHVTVVNKEVQFMTAVINEFKC